MSSSARRRARRIMRNATKVKAQAIEFARRYSPRLVAALHTESAQPEQLAGAVAAEFDPNLWPLVEDMLVSFIQDDRQVEFRAAYRAAFEQVGGRSK